MNHKMAVTRPPFLFIKYDIIKFSAAYIVQKHMP